MIALEAARWLAERTIAWLNRCRRLAKDWENLNHKALHSCASHPSASCSENFVIPLDVPGRTLTIGSPANHAAKLASNWKAEGIFLTNTARKVAGFEEVD